MGRSTLPGWFRYKLPRGLSEDERSSLKELAGPLYRPWDGTIVAHENCAWLFERWAAFVGLPARCIGRPPAPAPLADFPRLSGLRDWVPAFCTSYQQNFVLQYGPKDGVLCVLPTGAGKTLIGIIYGLMRPGTVVFITRASARRTVASEIRRFTEFEPYVIEGAREGDIPADNTRFVVVGWESLQTHVDRILRVAPTTFIADEIHLAKSHKRYEAVVAHEGEDVVRDEDGKEKIEFRKLKNRFAAAETLSRRCQFHLGLTATPIRDRLRDLWAQLDLIHPRGWGGFYPWARRYCDAAPSKWGGIDTTGTGSPVAMEELLARMSFSTFHVAQSVTHRDLPAKRRQVTYVRSDELLTGRDVMKEVREHAFRSATGEAWAKLALAAAMKRKRVVEEAVLGAWKAPEGRTGGKVVIFTGLRADAERIAEALRKPSSWGAGAKRSLPTIFVGHGGRAPQERDRIREDYMAHPGPCVLIGTIDSFGESLNLQDTDLAIMAMLPFTPGQVRQAEGRFVRLGMTRPCLILYLIAEGTADEHVAESLLRKLPAVDAVAKDEVLTEFGKDLKGDAEQIAAGLLAKMLAANEEDGDGDLSDSEIADTPVPEDEGGSAAAARDEALARVAAGAPSAWLAEAEAVVRGLAASGKPFTADDVWRRIMAEKPPEPRALGPVMMKLVRGGVIEKTGRSINTVRASSHAAPITEWIGTRRSDAEMAEEAGGARDA